VNYCINGIVDIKELNGAHLLLTASNKIKSFSLTERIFKSNQYEIFTRGLNKFLHETYDEYKIDGFTQNIKLTDIESLLPFSIQETKYKLNSIDNFKMYPKVNEEEIKVLAKIWDIISKSSEEELNDTILKCRLKDVLSSWALIPVRFGNSEEIYAAPVEVLDMILIKDDSLVENNMINVFQVLELPFLAKPEISLLKAVTVDLTDG
jgi:hypothetical protein